MSSSTCASAPARSWRAGGPSWTWSTRSRFQCSGCVLVCSGCVLDDLEEGDLLGEKNWTLQLGKGCRDPLWGAAALPNPPAPEILWHF